MRRAGVTAGEQADTLFEQLLAILHALLATEWATWLRGNQVRPQKLGLGAALIGAVAHSQPRIHWVCHVNLRLLADKHLLDSLWPFPDKKTSQS